MFQSKISRSIRISQETCFAECLSRAVLQAGCFMVRPLYRV